MMMHGLTNFKFAFEVSSPNPTDTKLKEKDFFQQGQAFGLNFSDGAEYR
jgi:hypothetical protein